MVSTDTLMHFEFYLDIGPLNEQPWAFVRSAFEPTFVHLGT